MPHVNRASTSLHERGQDLQVSMHPSGSHRGSESKGKRFCNKKFRLELGDNCTCLDRSDEEDYTESKEAREASSNSRIHLRALVNLLHY